MSQYTLCSTNNPALGKNQASVEPKYQRKAQQPIKIFDKETEEVGRKSLPADSRFIPMDIIDKIQNETFADNHPMMLSKIGNFGLRTNS
jgi:hypothetical protein